MHHKTLAYQQKLKDIIATQKSVIGKRNQMFSKLKSRMYDAKLMFYFMQAFRELEEKWFTTAYHYKEGKLEPVDFFVLLYAMNAGDFWATDVVDVTNKVPAEFKHRYHKPEQCLARLKTLGLLRCFKTTASRERKWFITPDGKWFLMERTRDLRRIVIDCLTRESKPRRRLIIGGKKI